jgi:hypothetical protein
MKRIALFSILATAGIIGLCFAQDPSSAPAQPGQEPETLASVRLDEFTIHPGKTCKNLTVFMITGPQPLKDRKLLTLDEALEAKTITIKETGNVNQLEAVNSGDVDVYIPSGTIFRGGKQDRMCGEDYIIGSGKTVPLQSFCVERGRWTQRGNAPVTHFQKSKNIDNSRELKLASRRQASQGQVWSQVANKQTKLSDKIEQDVRSGESSSSLELALDNKKLQEEIDHYVKQLEDLPSRRDDTIGYAFAINSKVYVIDTYGSKALFVKLWPKLLRSASIEAISDRTEEQAEPAKVADVQKLLKETAAGKQEQPTQAGGIQGGQIEAEKSMGWTSSDGDKLLRLNIINTEGLEELRQAPAENQGNRMQQNLNFDDLANQETLVAPGRVQREENQPAPVQQEESQPEE